MTQYRYRDRDGGLEAAFVHTAWVGNLVELREYLNQAYLTPLGKHDTIKFVILPVAQRAFAKDRGRWETHTVYVNGEVVGYSDGVIPDATTGTTSELGFDPTQYQVEINGKATDVSKLDINQLRQHLCASMETIELLDAQIGGASQIMKDYRDGRIKPPIQPLEHLIGLVDAAKEYLQDRFPSERGRFTIVYDKLVSCKDQLLAAKKEKK